MDDILKGFRVVSSVEDDTLPEDNDSELIKTLKKMLAEAYVLYHTIHGFHWNVKGSDFYEYHKLFDEIVDDVYESVDPIAENIMKLDGVAPFGMDQLIGLSSIKEAKLENNDPKELATRFIEMNQQYINNIKEAFKVANNNNEQGIANFIAERIDQHQKWNWFLKASVEG
jgi:starvation-inducible DNA-binding protein